MSSQSQGLQMKHADLEKWTAAAWAIQKPLKKLPVPHGVFTMEAVDAARFVKLYWEPVSASASSDGRPGLRSAFGARRDGLRMDAEILELVGAFNAAHTRYRLSIDFMPASPVTEAKERLRALRDALRWHFDQVGSELGRAQLRKLGRLHADAHSHDALAAALFNYAALAEMHESALDGVLEFGPSTVGDTRRLATVLRERRSRTASLEEANQVARCLELRNRIATLLHDRVRQVRAAARIVFKRHPEIVHGATSDYERQRQARRREKASRPRA